MTKVKMMKEVSLLELLQIILNNELIDKQQKFSGVALDEYENTLTVDSVDLDEKFQVLTEINVTHDMVFDNLAIVFKDDSYGGLLKIKKSASIKQVLDKYLGSHNIKSIYVLDANNNEVLVW
ncbi:hypothetical protein C7J88_09610 [Staphylococcus muscae]|uniref:Uncharacterized protein n=1 Tax=Staphylococcus muscae TaxID=1294 RepID=A0A240BXS4_9STAP|nr:hypothetical protein [Staphylococcus muscae]AVQ34405.1 hypothetical protein C7J88_09610 [Staphylococcus muscae]PNZ01007.1 hypothetical protein CD131_09635 [Staphylococcus muscae]GGA93351.1 hypothetical protein GCM10007183_16930 [Staphylococcus muscae]SNW00651.1 Uncharacterised protein [Staphylococcus muscae]